MPKRNKVLVGVGGAVLLVGIILVSASAKRERGVEVRFAKVGRRDLVAAVTSSGKIQPKKKVDISPDIQGRITQIAVREGDLVTKGQFLLQIDPTLYRSEEHTSELQSHLNLVCRLLLEKKKKKIHLLIIYAHS